MDNRMQRGTNRPTCLVISSCHVVAHLPEDVCRIVHGGDSKWLEVKQVARGHNIVADGWVGACIPHPYPPPPQTNSHTQTIIATASYMHVFILFNSITTDGWTDGWINGWKQHLIELGVRN